jgi:signal transduction histidine kinase
VALLHGGSITLTNLDGKGVRAELRLALSPPSVEA